jgi:hypothetical protein
MKEQWDDLMDVIVLIVSIVGWGLIITLSVLQIID